MLAWGLEAVEVVVWVVVSALQLVPVSRTAEACGNYHNLRHKTLCKRSHVDIRKSNCLDNVVRGYRSPQYLQRNHDPKDISATLALAWDGGLALSGMAKG